MDSRSEKGIQRGDESWLIDNIHIIINRLKSISGSALSNEQPISVLVPPSREIVEYGPSKFSSHLFSIPWPAIPFSLLINENAVTFAEPESSLDGIVQFTHHKLR